MIGGTGNQLFQYTTARCDSLFSSLFLTQTICKMIGWTSHERLFDFPRPVWFKHFFHFVVLSLDIFLAKLVRKSLFTTFDTRSISISPCICEINRFGYFQNDIELQAIPDISEMKYQPTPTKDCVLHIRGGDLIQRNELASYGVLDLHYYSQAIDIVFHKLSANASQVDIITDDIPYANSILAKINDQKFRFSSGDIIHDFTLACSSKWFIASNSTLSYWIVRIRNGQNCVVPEPFQVERKLKLPDCVIQITKE